MNYRSFEQQIASTLRAAEEPFDTAAFIESLHGKKRERSRPVLIWWLMGAGILLGVLYFSTLKSHDKPEALRAAVLPAPPASVPSTPEMPATATSGQEGDESNAAVKTSGPTQDLNGASGREINKNTFNNISEEIADSKIMATVTAANATSEASTTLQRKTVVLPEAIAAVMHRPEIKASALPAPKYGKIVCPDFSNRSRPYLEIIPEAGVFAPLKRLESTGTEASNIYALRNKNESSLEGINIGLYARLRKEKLPFYLSAGVSYSRLTEKMNLNYSYIRKDTTQGIISITKSQSGDTITVIYGDIIREKKITGYKVRHHNFSLVDLPVALGYEKQAGNWTIGVEGGLALNLKLGSGGQILASDTSFVQTDASPRPFRSGVGLSYFGGLLAGRTLGNGHRVYLAARFRYLPQVFSSDNNPIQQGYSFAGLNAGYVITF